VIVRQVQQDREPGRALDQRPDRRLAAGTDDEVPLLTLLVLPDRLNLGDRWPSGSGYG
jgi:hypothetical protein